MNQLLTLMRTHLPSGGFAHIRRDNLKATICLALDERQLIFNVETQVLEFDSVASRLFVRNTVKGAIEALKQGKSYGASLPTE